LEPLSKIKYLHTCKINGLPPVAIGVDVISAAASDSGVEQIVKNLITKAKMN